MDISRASTCHNPPVKWYDIIIFNGKSAYKWQGYAVNSLEAKIKATLQEEKEKWLPYVNMKKR